MEQMPSVCSDLGDKGTPVLHIHPETWLCCVTGNRFAAFWPTPRPEFEEQPTEQPTAQLTAEPARSPDGE